jgi:hypothetical protein
MFSYYGIAAGITISVINYVLLGFQFPVDGFYIASFEIWLATTVVFYGSGNVGYSLLEYRLGHRQLVRTKSFPRPPLQIYFTYTCYLAVACILGESHVDPIFVSPKSLLRFLLLQPLSMLASFSSVG